MNWQPLRQIWIYLTRLKILYKISIPLRYSLYSKPWDLLNLTPRIVQVMGGEEAAFGDPGSLFAPQEEISLDDLADAKAFNL